jgi:hypothetical protein
MMPRVWRGGRQAWMAAAVLGLAGVVSWIGLAAAAVFETPPTLGNRRVELRWQPDADDPVYNGNTVLDAGPRLTTLHAPGRVVRVILASGDGSRAFSFAEGDNAIRSWLTIDGTVIPEYLPFGPGGAPEILALHASDRRLLGALPDGHLVLWRLERSDPPEVLPGAGPLRSLLLFPGLRDTADLRFVTVGKDDTLRVWRQPGQILGPGYAIPILGGATGALAMSADRRFVAVGTQDGGVRVYDIVTPPDTPRLRLTGHPGPVTGVVFTRGGGKLASVDETGQVRIWKMPEGTLLVPPVETGSVAPSIGFSPPEGRILFVALPNGTLQMRNGSDGSLYRAEPVFPQGALRVTAYALTADGIRTLIGDNNGGITVIRAGVCKAAADQPTCFGGYMVWRSPTPNIEDRKLLRVYSYADSTWTFLGAERVFSDPDSIIGRRNPRRPGITDPETAILIAGPQNGMPYYYSVTRFDLRYLEGGVFQVYPDSTEAVWKGFYRDLPGGPPTAIVAEAPARSRPPLLDQVIVVPNPYEIGKVPWEQLGEPHVEFRHLPEVATIRIYTLAGDLVRTIDHGRGRYQESSDAAAWNLRNSAGAQVTSGVYIYQVETHAEVTAGGEHLPGEVIEGYFTVVL